MKTLSAAFIATFCLFAVTPIGAAITHSLGLSQTQAIIGGLICVAIVCAIGILGNKAGSVEKLDAIVSVVIAVIVIIGLMYLYFSRPATSPEDSLRDSKERIERMDRIR